MKDAVGAVLPLGPQPEVFVQTARMLLARSALDGVELVRGAHMANDTQADDLGLRYARRHRRIKLR